MIAEEEGITADAVKPKYDLVKETWQRLLERYRDQDGHYRAEFMVEVACPYCAATEADAPFAVAGFRHVTCRRCGTVYVTPRLRDDHLRWLYDDDYYNTLYVESMIPAFEVRKRLIGQRKYQQVLKHGPQNGRVLDIGSGVGEVIDVFRDEGWACQAIEVNPSAVRWLERRGISVYRGAFESFADQEPFDVVMAWGVVEHVVDPRAFLKRAIGHLRTGGLFVSEVPNGQSLLVDHTRSTGIDPGRIVMGEQHVVLYSPITYVGLHEAAGLERIHVQTNGLDLETILKVTKQTASAKTVRVLQECLDAYGKGDLIRGFWRKPA